MLAALLATSLATAADAPLSPAQQQADYAQLWEALEDFHPSLHLHTSPAQLARVRAEVAQELDLTRSPAAFWALLMRSTEPIGCGHTDLFPSAATMRALAGEPLFPHDVVVVRDQLFLDPRAPGGGGRIHSVQGVPAAEVVTQLRGLVLADARDPGWKDTQIDLEGFWYLPLLFDHPDPWEVELEVDGQRQTHSWPAARPEEVHPISRATRMEAAVVDLHTGARSPVDRESLAGRALLLTVDTFDEDRVKEELLPALRLAARSKEVAGVVIDLRHNGGGTPAAAYALFGHLIESTELVYDQKQYRSTVMMDLFKTSERTIRRWQAAHPNQPPQDAADGLIDVGYRRQAWVRPRRPTYRGPVVVLTSASTFSTAADFAALVKRNGRGRVVGAPSGGHARLQTSGLTKHLTLTHSGVEVTIPLSRSRLADPDGRLGDGGVPPDLLLRPTLDDLTSTEDRVLAEALALLRGESADSDPSAP